MTDTEQAELARMQRRESMEKMEDNPTDSYFCSSLEMGKVNSPLDCEYSQSN
jgi:hypothetical protein